MRAAQYPDGRQSVWITRAEPGAAATATRVTAMGFSPIVEPLLTFRPLPAELDLGQSEALAFTSANAVSQTAALTAHRDVQVFAVGDATAEAARMAGFHDVVSANGDVETLTALIIHSAPNGAIVHLAARDTAGDLVGRLQAVGVSARKVAVYETHPSVALPSSIKAALADVHLVAALFHSPRAAHTAAALLKPFECALAQVCAIGLSPACIAPLSGLGFKSLISAEQPNETFMVQALAQVGLSASHDR